MWLQLRSWWWGAVLLVVPAASGALFFSTVGMSDVVRDTSLVARMPIPTAADLINLNSALAIDYVEATDRVYLSYRLKSARLHGEMPQARLRTIDVSDPASPRIISDVAIGYLNPSQIAVRGKKLLVTALDGIATPVERLILFDLADPSMPRRIDALDWQKTFRVRMILIAVSEDGAKLIINSDNGRSYIDIADFSNPKLFTGAPPAGIYPQVQNRFEVKKASSPGSDPIAVERDGRVTVYRDGIAAWHFATGVMTGSGPAFVLRGGNAVLLVLDGEFQFHAPVPPGDPGRLIDRADRDAMALFARYKQTVPILALLADAGVETLLDDNGGSILPGPRRVEILRNYVGILRQHRPDSRKPKDYDKIFDIAKRIVELAPDDAPAREMLADLYLEFLGARPWTFIQGETLWHEAASQFEIYRRLTNQSSDLAAKLAFYPLFRATPSTDPVCMFVADAFNAENWTASSRLPSKERGLVEIDGMMREFRVETGNGSCAVSAISGINPADPDASVDPPPGLSLSGPQAIGSARLSIMPFEGTDYVVESDIDEPYGVYHPISGKQCGFRVNYRTVLVESSDPDLCAQFLSGNFKSQVSWQSIARDAIQELDTRSTLASAIFDRVAEVDLDGSGTMTRIGHFSNEGRMSCTCDLSGVALLSGNASAAGEANDSLINKQSEFANCYGADADLIQLNGRNYIEARSGPLAQTDLRDRALLQKIGEQFQTVCRVRNFPIYRPVQAHMSK